MWLTTLVLSPYKLNTQVLPPFLSACVSHTHTHTHAHACTQRALHSVFLLGFWQTTTVTFKGGEAAWLWSQGMETEPEWNVNRPCGLSTDAKLPEKGEREYVCVCVSMCASERERDDVWQLCRGLFCACVWTFLWKCIPVHACGWREYYLRCYLTLFSVTDHRRPCFTINMHQTLGKHGWTSLNSISVRERGKQNQIPALRSLAFSLFAWFTMWESQMSCESHENPTIDMVKWFKTS